MEVMAFCGGSGLPARQCVRRRAPACARLRSERNTERGAGVAVSARQKPKSPTRARTAAVSPSSAPTSLPPLPQQQQQQKRRRPVMESRGNSQLRAPEAALPLVVTPPVRRISWDTLSNKPHRNVVSYNLQLKTMCKSGDLDGMLELLRDMQSCGAHPDLMSYATVLHCCRKVGATDKAAEILRDMRRSGIQPDQRIFTRMLSVYRHAKPPRVHEAYNILQEMRRSPAPLSTLSCNMVLEACANRREVMLGLQVYGLMKEYNVKANEKTFDAMARLYINVRMFDEAIEMYNLMVRSGIQLSTAAYTQMIYALSQKGRYDECFVTFEEMISVGLAPLLSTYNILITAAACACNFAKAERYFAELAERGLRSDRHTHNAFLFACLKSQQLERAVGVYEAMGKDNVSPNCATYRTLIRLAADVGDEAILRRLIADVRHDMSCTPSHATLIELTSSVALLLGVESGARVLRDLSSRSELTKEFFQTLSETLSRRGVSLSAFVRALGQEC